MYKSKKIYLLDITDYENHIESDDDVDKFNLLENIIAYFTELDSIKQIYEFKEIPDFDQNEKNAYINVLDDTKSDKTNMNQFTFDRDCKITKLN